MELYKGKVYTDQQTGKNFNRPRYQMLKEEILESGDTLIVTELDSGNGACRVHMQDLTP